MTPRPPSAAHSAVIRPMAARRAWYKTETSGRAAPIAAAPVGATEPLDRRIPLPGGR